MIRGIVNSNLEAILRLTVRGPGSQRERIEALIDTGFDGSLGLPPAIIGRLGLPWRRRAQAVLADGSTCVFDVYEAVVIWNRRSRLISVDEADSTPLIGTSLLQGYELNVPFRIDGEVAIRSLRRKRQ